MSIGDKVKLVARTAERQTNVPIGSVGTIKAKATRALLVAFPQDERWCWPSELAAA